MKPPDLHKIFFPLNIFLTGIVFLLLAPTVRIYSGWFPEKKNSLWLFPLLLVFLSSAVWFLADLSLPSLIKKGVLEDRRKKPRFIEPPFKARFFRQLMPIVVFVIHMLILVLFSATLVDFMKTNPLERLLVNLP